MAFNIGINVLETDGKAAPSIQAAATSVAAFVIRSERGLPGVVRRVSSPGQFRDFFGGFIDGAYGAFAVQGFFDNGGATAYVARVVDLPDPPPEGEAPVTTGKAVPATLAFDSVLTVTAGYRGAPDPGAWGNDLAVHIRTNAVITTTYDLLVQYKGAVVETWEKLTHEPEPAGPARRPDKVINDPATGSKYIMVSEPGNADPTPSGTEGTPPKAKFTSLAGGQDDALSETGNEADLTAALKDAFHLFDTSSVQLLACPESTENDVVTGGLDYCEGRGDCFFVGAVKPGLDNVEGVKDYSKTFQANKIYGALYYPWIQVADPRGGRIWVPPTGHVMGVFARIDQQRGIWKAPAGNEARVMGALATEFAISDTDHTELVKNGSVNAIRFIPGVGIVVDSSRTLSTNTLWLYVNVRLLFNMVKTSLKYGLRWVVQEPNREELWKKVKVNTVTPFLMGLWKKGAFGPGAAEDVFTVKCDADNNPPDSIQQGIFTLEVYFYPSRPAETVVIVVGQQEGASSAQEA